MSEVIPFEKPEPTEELKQEFGVSTEAVTITDVDQMGHIATNWHFQAIQDFHHKLAMPADVGIDIPTGEFDEDGNEKVID